jgi:exopolysaccharide production protein ExoZ
MQPLSANSPDMQNRAAHGMYLHRLQVLRLVAAMMVLIGHVQLRATEVAGLDLQAFRAIGSPNFYAAGVDIFFVISGFIMYTISWRDFGAPGSATRFVARRLARIVPPYWFFTAAMLLVVALLPGQLRHPQTSLDNVVKSFLFLPSLNAYGAPYPVLQLGWTVNFEMFFYAIFALGLLMPRRAGLTFVFGLIGLLGCAGMLMKPESLPISFWSLPVVFEFLFGIVLGMVHVRGARVNSVLAWVIGGLSFALLAWSSTHGGSTPFAPERVIWMGIPAGTICVAVVLCADGGAPGRVLRALAVGGDASYVLYLSHPFVLALMGVAWRWTGIVEPWVYVGVTTAASVGAAVACHVLVERHVTRAANRLLSGRTLHRAVTMPAGAESGR